MTLNYCLGDFTIHYIHSSQHFNLELTNVLQLATHKVYRLKAMLFVAFC